MVASEIQKDTITKSKKKRMKRLEAQRRKAKERELGNINLLNPNDQIRLDLSNLDIDVEVINVSIEEMWDKKLDYCDFDSVLTYILNRESIAPMATVSAGDVHDVTLNM